MAEIKTIKNWEESQCTWTEYCKPGDLVDEGVFDYFMNILPPRNLSNGYLQVGEPYSHRDNPKTGRWQATYSTFQKVEDGVYRYCGNCFAGEIEDVR